MVARFLRVMFVVAFLGMALSCLWAQSPSEIGMFGQVFGQPTDSEQVIVFVPRSRDAVLVYNLSFV